MLPPVPSVALKPRQESLLSLGKRKRFISAEGDEEDTDAVPQAKIRILTKTFSEAPHFRHVMKAKFGKSEQGEEWRMADSLLMKEDQLKRETKSQMNPVEQKHIRLNGNCMNKNINGGICANSGRIVKPDQTC